MSCDNCSSGEATKQAYFDGWTESWCDPCYTEFYLGEKLNPNKPVCELCPEGNQLHIVLSTWREKTFKVCNNCYQDLATETETRRVKLGLDKQSEV